MNRIHLEEEIDANIWTATENSKVSGQAFPSIGKSEAGLKKPTLVSNRLRRPGESLAARAYQQIRDEILRGDVIREALESQAARLCAEHITAADKKQLLTSARHLDNLHKVSGPEAEDARFLFSVHTYHMQFHMRIAELGQCPGLTSAIEKAQVLVFNWLYDTAANNNKTPAKFHSNLADALCSGDPLVADSAMRAHIRNGLDQVLERLASSEHGNSWRLKSARN
jgi:DNA-binding GntR family transcriptional regulator